eukprot:7791167-Pyramimonas_sp.AAC.1
MIIVRRGLQLSKHCSINHLAQAPSLFSWRGGPGTGRRIVGEGSDMLQEAFTRNRAAMPSRELHGPRRRKSPTLLSPAGPRPSGAGPAA